MTKEEAIKKLMFERDNIDTEGYCGTKENYAKIDAYNMAIEALTERPTGEWMDSRDTDTPWNDGFKCSACNRNSLIRYNFCPYCGADMGADMKGNNK